MIRANQRTAEQSIKILEQAEKGSQTILEQENTRLKRLLAERMREMDDLKEAHQKPMHEEALEQSTQPGAIPCNRLSIRGRPARRYGEGAK